MNICFCLPSLYFKPIGGYKIVYQYANLLSKKGNNVTIVYVCKNRFRKLHLHSRIVQFLCQFLIKNDKSWFCFEQSIKRKAIFDISDNFLKENYDAIFATAVDTAIPVYSLSDSKGKKCYLIQDFENWNCSDEYVYETYKLGMENITISKWLRDIVNNNSLKASHYIPNAIDTSIFKVINNIEDRNPYSIALLYHKASHKGVKYALSALFKLKEKYPQLVVNMFGVPEKPKDIPEWIKYTRNADEKHLRDIYNKSSIFMCASIDEGFGLTGAESMACGCALVSSSYKGVLEYAKNKENCLLSEIKDVNKMCENIEELFNDNTLRIKLAKNGVRDIKNNTWNVAVNKIERIINE